MQAVFVKQEIKFSVGEGAGKSQRTAVSYFERAFECH